MYFIVQRGFGSKLYSCYQQNYCIDLRLPCMQIPVLLCLVPLIPTICMFGTMKSKVLISHVTASGMVMMALTQRMNSLLVWFNVGLTEVVPTWRMNSYCTYFIYHEWKEELYKIIASFFIAPAVVCLSFWICCMLDYIFCGQIYENWYTLHVQLASKWFICQFYL